MGLKILIEEISQFKGRASLRLVLRGYVSSSGLNKKLTVRAHLFISENEIFYFFSNQMLGPTLQ